MISGLWYCGLRMIVKTHFSTLRPKPQSPLLWGCLTAPGLCTRPLLECPTPCPGTSLWSWLFVGASCPPRRAGGGLGPSQGWCSLEAGWQGPARQANRALGAEGSPWPACGFLLCSTSTWWHLEELLPAPSKTVAASSVDRQASHFFSKLCKPEIANLRSDRKGMKSCLETQTRKGLERVTNQP